VLQEQQDARKGVIANSHFEVAAYWSFPEDDMDWFRFQQLWLSTSH
jgi:hypothetical protein